MPTIGYCRTGGKPSGAAVMSRYPRKKQPTPPPEREEGEVYGWLLTMRFLAAAAIDKEVTGPMLRVLCLLAEHADGEGRVFVGENTLAARLDISRQAIAKTLRKLSESGWLDREREEGRTTRYVLDRDGFESERAGWHRVLKRRASNKEARAKRRTGGPRRNVEEAA
jgi:DNA-binding transcriptional ArsR family regulator